MKSSKVQVLFFPHSFCGSLPTAWQGFFQRGTLQDVHGVGEERGEILAVLVIDGVRL